MPVECVWIGPLLTDYDCSSCILGYETTSPDDATCVKPNFRPHKHWEGSVEQSQLKLQGTGGAPEQIDPDSNTTILFTGHTYTIPAPQLEPKERMFAGYKQPHTKIHYELDFSLGAEVDIGCGTAVVGNGALDVSVSKKHTTHPLSMEPIQFQWSVERAVNYATKWDSLVDFVRFTTRTPDVAYVRRSERNRIDRH